MAKSKYLLHPKHPLRTIAYIILAVGLVVGGFVTLKASQTSTEGRSKAVEEKIISANWDFAFQSNEGWLNRPGLTPVNAENDILHVAGRDGSVNPSIFISGIEHILGIGNKKVHIRMSIKPKEGHKIDNCCKFQIFTGVPDNQGKRKLAYELPFSVKANGKMDLYKIKIPTPRKLKVTEAVLEFKGLNKGDSAEVDFIRFVLEKAPSRLQVNNF